MKKIIIDIGPGAHQEEQHLEGFRGGECLEVGKHFLRQDGARIVHEATPEMTAVETAPATVAQP